MKDRFSLYSVAGILLVVFLLSGCLPTQPSVKILSRPEILWDSWGVPHISAEEDSDAFYAFGWAQMRSHGDLLLKLYAVARGRGAEFFDESYLPADRSVRTLGIPALAEKWYAKQNADFRNNLDAFAAGINDFAQQYPEAISKAVRAVLPITPQDVIAHTTRVATVFVAGISECGAVLPGFDFQDQPVASNGWALAPPYSANGSAMLLANPHLDWQGLETFYESHFLLPDTNLYGAALIGFPVLQIAFNDRLGWTHTVNPMDGCDLFELKLAGATLDKGYLLDDEIQSFVTATETIQIRQPDGGMMSESLLVRRAKQGPVIEAADQVLAVRFAVLETALLIDMNRQWWEMGHATNLNEFQTILQGQHLPLFNVVYADADKHIMLAYNGVIPKRTTKEADFWRKPVPGDHFNLIWTEIYPFNALPKTIDPPSGWVQNSNGAPWYMTMPFLDKNDYPPNIASDVINSRELRGLQILNERTQMSYEDLIAAKHSTHSLVADQLLDELIDAARNSDNQLLQQAAEVLYRWDRQYQTESRGGWLFNLWFHQWQQATLTAAIEAGHNLKTPYGPPGSHIFYAQPFDPVFPLTTPRGLADIQVALAALGEAANELQMIAGSLDVAWGDLARLRRGSVDLPGNGAGTELGVFREMSYAQDSDGKFKSYYGDTYVAVVEFSQPVRAQVLNTYGNATQNHEFHIGDQLHSAAKQQLRPAWRTLAEIEANLMMRESLRN